MLHMTFHALFGVVFWIITQIYVCFLF